MKNICYKTNPIKEAIARIDFLAPLTEIEKGVPKQIIDSVKKVFPVAETNEIIGTQFQISNKKVQHNQVKTTEWNFYDKERSKRACISPSYFFIDVNKYSTYEKFNLDFSLIQDSLFSQYPSLQVKRFGVRYINQIIFPRGNAFSWDKFSTKIYYQYLMSRDKNLIYPGRYTILS